MRNEIKKRRISRYCDPSVQRSKAVQQLFWDSFTTGIASGRSSIDSGATAEVDLIPVLTCSSSTDSQCGRKYKVLFWPVAVSPTASLIMGMSRKRQRQW